MIPVPTLANHRSASQQAIVEHTRCANHERVCLPEVEQLSEHADCELAVSEIAIVIQLLLCRDHREIIAENLPRLGHRSRKIRIHPDIV